MLQYNVVFIAFHFRVLVKTQVTSRACLHTLGMDSENFDAKSIVSFKTLNDNQQYPNKDFEKLLPLKEGVALKNGTTELKILTDKNEPREVGVVSLIVKDDEIRNIEKVELLAETTTSKEPIIVKDFKSEDLKVVKENLLKGRNPILTKAIILRITKNSNKPVNLKVNIKICITTTSGKMSISLPMD
jgi:hypothetical protein